MGMKFCKRNIFQRMIRKRWLKSLVRIYVINIMNMVYYMKYQKMGRLKKIMNIII